MKTHGYLELMHYHITIPPPIVVNGKKNVIRDDVYVEIRNLIPDITEIPEEEEEEEDDSIH